MVLVLRDSTENRSIPSLSLHVKQKEVSQKITSLSNKIQLGQRGVATLRKTLSEVESQISDLDAAKEIAKKGNQYERKVKVKWRKTSQNGKLKNSYSGNAMNQSELKAKTHRWCLAREKM